MEENKYVTVTALTRYIYYKFDKDIHLQEVFLKGEISNFKKSGRHFYFSLKDENAEISAMMFYPENTTVTFDPADGMKVQVTGRVQVYEKRGTYSILVRKMEEEGIGALYAAFLALKEKLQKEGLFDEVHKLPLPEYPMHVGIITAPTGDAIHDIISTFNRRLPLARLTIYPALVQGSDAPKDLVRALKLAYKLKREEVIIIGRGGGSFEDLNCFNDEELVRTLFASPIPTVSAIGHEADYTICDYVASYRAPTPTGAAMRLTKDKNDVLKLIASYEERLKNSASGKIDFLEKHVKQLAQSYGLSNFENIIRNKEREFLRLNDNLHSNSPVIKVKNYQENLGNYAKRLKTSMDNYFSGLSQQCTELKNRLRVNLVTDRINQLATSEDTMAERLDTLYRTKLDHYQAVLDKLNEKAIILNPLNLMSKGYSIVYHNGEVVTKVADLNLNNDVDVKMADGKFSALVTSIERGEYGK